MGNKCVKQNKFQRQQKKDEFYNRKINIQKIGNHKPHQVFFGEDLLILSEKNIVKGLNSLCESDIHICIASNPTRIILSYIDNDVIHQYKKGNTFHIYKILYKSVTTIEDITQYDIYNAIQDYVYVNKQEPKHENIIIPV